jgi:hypothetical protein
VTTLTSTVLSAQQTSLFRVFGVLLVPDVLPDSAPRTADVIDAVALPWMTTLLDGAPGTTPAVVTAGWRRDAAAPGSRVLVGATRGGVARVFLGSHRAHTDWDDVAALLLHPRRSFGLSDDQLPAYPVRPGPADLVLVDPAGWHRFSPGEWILRVMSAPDLRNAP